MEFRWPGRDPLRLAGITWIQREGTGSAEFWTPRSVQQVEPSWGRRGLLRIASTRCFRVRFPGLRWIARRQSIRAAAFSRNNRRRNQVYRTGWL